MTRFIDSDRTRLFVKQDASEQTLPEHAEGIVKNIDVVNQTISVEVLFRYARPVVDLKGGAIYITHCRCGDPTVFRDWEVIITLSECEIKNLELPDVITWEDSRPLVVKSEIIGKLAFDWDNIE